MTVGHCITLQFVKWSVKWEGTVVSSLLLLLLLLSSCATFHELFLGLVRYTTDFPHFYNPFRPICVVAKRTR